MSHYICATIDDEEVNLAPGTSWRTLSAISLSGFDPYSLYSAPEYHSGMSGIGKSKKVNGETARTAYLHAMAWTLALQLSFPDAFREQLDYWKEYYEPLDAYLLRDHFDEGKLEQLVADKARYHSGLNEDKVNRSLGFFLRALQFSRRLYLHTQEGKSVEVFFG